MDGTAHLVPNASERQKPLISIKMIMVETAMPSTDAENGLGDCFVSGEFPENRQLERVTIYQHRGHFFVFDCWFLQPRFFRLNFECANFPKLPS